MTSSIHPPCISAHIIHHTPTGARYLLIRRSCGGYLHGTWQMVTGRIEEGETAIQAAFREIEEETGCIPTELYSADAVETFFIHSQNKIVLVPVFVAFVENMDVRLCPEEHDAYEWLPFEEAQKRLVWAEQRRVLAHVHELFGTKEPSPMLLIEKPAPVPSSKPMISRTGVYGIAMENKKLLVVRQSKGPHAGKWDLPGGGMEFGETVEEALRREFREEVGMTFDSMQFFANATAFTEAQDHSYVLYQVGLIYKVTGVALLGTQVAEMEHAWINLEQLKLEEISPFVAQSLNP